MPDLEKKENLEAEAKTKWCPFARELVHHRMQSGLFVQEIRHSLASANRATDGVHLAACFCIASDCMAWLPVEGTCGLVRRDLTTWDSLRSKSNASSTNQGDAL